LPATAPDNTNNALVLAFAVLIVTLIVEGLALDHGQPKCEHDVAEQANEFSPVALMAT